MTSSRTILVTGSSSGFGHVTSTTLARRGHRVFASMRDVGTRNAATAKALEQVAADEHLELSVLELDVCDDGSVNAAVESIIGEAGQLDVLINNAGAGIHGILETISVEQARELFETNVHSVLRMNRAVLPHMRNRGSGLLIHISSGLARLMLPFNGIYSATKCALEALAEAYRYELASVGVDSIIVEPGVYATGFFEAAEARRPADAHRAGGYGDLYELSLDMASRRPPAGDPAEVAEALAELIEMPAGTRPLRTTVGWAAQRADRLNETALELHRTVFEQTGMSDVVTLAPANAETQEA